MSKEVRNLIEKGTWQQKIKHRNNDILSQSSRSSHNVSLIKKIQNSSYTGHAMDTKSFKEKFYDVLQDRLNTIKVRGATPLVEIP